MNPAAVDSGQVLDLLAQALALPAEERSHYMDHVAADDATLRAELHSLLAADAQAGRFLEPTVFDPSARPIPVDRAGERVGVWRLQRLLGRGGMGEVWLAQRDDGLYEAHAAIKFLRQGHASQVERFERERRVLASLSHPNIARLLDAGWDAHGLPWVAMDHVDGQPLDAWARERKLAPKPLVTVFIKVVEAVAFAHARLVVHRDLKPANILVDRSGEPHLLDFGIAKLLDEAEPGLTVAGIAPMTPDYASPEQLKQAPIGVASDVWSLGAILYELLTGSLPSPRGSRRTGTGERPPALPSRIAANHGVRLPRELDHVLLKALALQPADRYRDCAALAADLGRFLAGRPVHAHAAGRGYRTWKLLLRHRLAATVAATIALVLAGSAAFSALQARDARAQAAIAAQERERTARLNMFLEAILAAPDPSHAGRALTLAEVLDRAAERLGDAAIDDSAGTAAMHLVLARGYRALGLRGPALSQALVAVTRHAESSERSPEQAWQLADARLIATQLMIEGRQFKLASKQLRAVEEAFGYRDLVIAGVLHNQRALLEHDRDRLDQAERHYLKALDLVGELGPERGADRTAVMQNIAALRFDRGDYVGARSLRRKVVAQLEQIHGGPHPVLAISRGNLALDEEMLGDLARAGALLERRVADEQVLHGERHPLVTRSKLSLASLRLAQDDIEAVRALLDEVADLIIDGGAEMELSRARVLTLETQIAYRLGELERVPPLLERARQQWQALAPIGAWRLDELDVIEVLAAAPPPTAERIERLDQSLTRLGQGRGHERVAHRRLQRWVDETFGRDASF